MDEKYLQSAARVVWDTKLANLYEHEASKESFPGARPPSCPSCSAVWVPGITCYVRTTTNHNLNKKARMKKHKKLEKYLAKCQKYKTFDTRKQVTIEYECRCSEKYGVKTLLPTQIKANKPPCNTNKSKAARERSKRRKDLRLDQSETNNPIAALAAPTLSLNDFLL